MRSFTIDKDNNITIHGSRKAADATGETAFSTEQQLADALGSDMKRLVEIWNSLTGVTPVKKFENRKKAVARIWREIQKLGASTPADVDAQARDVAPEPAKPGKKAKAAKKTPTGEPKAPRDGSKQEKAIAMMKRPGGATISELMSTFGWQAHTVRGFVAGTLGKKMGLTVESTKPEGGERTYRITS